MKKNGYIAVLVFLVSRIAVYSQTFEVVPYLENGDTDKRINFVYVSEGYTAAEFDQFIEDAEYIIGEQFEYSPYLEYKNFFNIYLIKVPSAESGTDHPQTSSDSDCQDVPVMQNDTYFNSTFDAYGIHRLLTPGTWPYTLVTDVLMENTPYYDQAGVIVNTPYYGGSGGDYFTGSVHSSAVAIMTHESGHSFGELNDEYWAGSVYAHEAPNMTQESDPTLVKWKNWLGDEGIGIYPYGDTPPLSEWFRPHQSCLMRFLYGQFCAVCREALIDKIYTLVSPIDGYSPAGQNIDYDDEEELNFSVDLVRPEPDTLVTTWYLDGEVIAGDTETLILTPSVTGEEDHVLTVEVRDDTPLSRSYVFAQGYIFDVTWNINNSTGITDNGAEKFIYKIYPNPVADVLHFDYRIQNATHPVSMEITDVQGRKMMKRIFPAGQGIFHREIDVSGWQQGIYFMSIQKGSYQAVFPFFKE